MNKNVYLGNVTLQKDARVRLPKNVLINLGIKQGETAELEIYYDSQNDCMVIKKAEEEYDNWSTKKF